MRFEMRLLCGLAMLLMVPAVGGAASSTPTIQLVVPTIDDPAAGVIGTRAADINNAGNIVFNLDTAAATNSEVGFRPNEGKYKGKFLAPQTYPGAIVSIADQMNNSSTIAGEWEDSTFHFHGFTLNSGVFTTFDVSAAGAFATGLLGINDQGDLAGIFTTLTPTEHDSAFVVIGGVETDFDVAGAVGDDATAINNADVAVGNYSTTDPFIVEATCGCHGYMRAANGTITTFDPTGSVSTVPHGLSNNNIVVGRYYDSLSVLHGFVYFLNSGQSITYDYPGATATSLNGINGKGMIAGRYTDTAGVAHGFIARLVK